MGAARCPAGHPIDPSWKSCPYCERLQAGEGAATQRLGSPGGAALDPPEGPKRTRLEGGASGASPDRRTRLEGEPAWPVPVPPSPGPKPTRLEESEGTVKLRRTVLQDAEGAPPAPPEPRPAHLAGVDAAGPAEPAGASLRRLVAVLAAPDSSPGGLVFPVRAGKNSIGADRGVEIVLAGDSEVSGEHAVILHRNGTFHLADRLSTNGTWVNGREVPANGTVLLHDRDRIRCGKTELVFLMIEPESPNTRTA